MTSPDVTPPDQLANATEESSRQVLPKLYGKNLSFPLEFLYEPYNVLNSEFLMKLFNVICLLLLYVIVTGDMSVSENQVSKEVDLRMQAVLNNAYALVDLRANNGRPQCMRTFGM